MGSASATPPQGGSDRTAKRARAITSTNPDAAEQREAAIANLTEQFSIVFRESMPSVSASVNEKNSSKIYSNLEYISPVSEESRFGRTLSGRTPGAQTEFVVYSACPTSVL